MRTRPVIMNVEAHLRQFTWPSSMLPDIYLEGVREIGNSLRIAGLWA